MGVVGEIFKGFELGKEGNPGRFKSKDYGVYITGKSIYDLPERDGEMITIPGRNGTLYRDNGRFKNIDVTYKAGIYAENEEAFAEAIAQLRYQLGARASYYTYIYDDYNPDEFRLGVFKGGLEVLPVSYDRAGEFDIVFDCKPQRFLKSGETAVSITSGHILPMPSSAVMPSAPLLSFQGNGTITMSNNWTFTITVSGAPSGTMIYIDCETGEAYNPTSGQSMNEYVSIGADLPILRGSTTFTYSSTITNFRVYPRWWVL